LLKTVKQLSAATAAMAMLSLAATAILGAVTVVPASPNASGTPPGAKSLAGQDAPPDVVHGRRYIDVDDDGVCDNRALRCVRQIPRSSCAEANRGGVWHNEGAGTRRERNRQCGVRRGYMDADKASGDQQT